MDMPIENFDSNRPQYFLSGAGFNLLSTARLRVAVFVDAPIDALASLLFFESLAAADRN